MHDSKVTGISSGTSIKRNLISWRIKCICLMTKITSASKGARFFSTVRTATCFRRVMSSSHSCLLYILTFVFLLSVIITVAWWRWITNIFRPSPWKTMQHLFITNSSYFHFVLSKIRFYRWVFWVNIHPQQKFRLRKRLEHQQIPEHSFYILQEEFFYCSVSLVCAEGIFPSSALRSNLTSRISLAFFYKKGPMQTSVGSGFL